MIRQAGAHLAALALRLIQTAACSACAGRRARRNVFVYPRNMYCFATCAAFDCAFLTLVPYRVTAGD